MTDHGPVVLDAAGEDLLQDRRRPERPGHVSSLLIPLMRSEDILTAAQALGAPDPDHIPMGEVDEDLCEGDQLRSIRGILFGILLSLPFWFAIAAALR